MILKYEAGSASPDAARAVKLAEILGQDPARFLLLAELQRCARNRTMTPLLFRSVTDLLRQRGSQGVSPLGLESHVSLLDFPRYFEPLTVIVGDKREEEPRNAGDLFVFSASTVDDRWLLSLGLDRDTEKISDKVLFTAYKDKDWLRRRLGQTNILCIGSPASNLFAREHNRCFLFRFAISLDANHRWKREREELQGRQTPAQLLEYREQSKHNLKHMMRLFKQPGFVDFNYQHLKVGIDPAENRDFAVVSIGRNPWADPADPYFSILAAGVHHPGTAKAVQFLADPTNFVKHPLGGVLEVEVPGDGVKPEEVAWHTKIGLSEARWHTVGSSQLEYTPDSLRKELVDRWLPKLNKEDLVTDFAISEGELQRHIELIDRLKAARAPGLP